MLSSQNLPLPLIIIFFLVGIGISFAWYADKTFPQTAPEQIFCTQDVKECTDGSYVSRTGPNCEFAECPNPSNSAAQKGVDGTNSYQNKEYGFEFSYRGGWRLGRELFEPAPLFAFSNGETSISILPRGEFDYGISPEESEELSLLIGKRNAKARTWTFKDDTMLVMITITNPPSGWNKDNRIEFRTSSKNFSIMLSDLSNNLTFPGLSTSTSSTNPTAGWKTYRNEEFGFEFKYPSNYNLKTTKINDCFYTTLNGDGPYFCIESHPNTEGISLIQWWKQQRESMYLIQQENIKMAGNDALVFYSKPGDFPESVIIFKYLSFVIELSGSGIPDQIPSTFKFITPEPVSQISCTWHDDCPSNSVCYNSQPNSFGIKGPVEGDKLCHRKCIDDSLCNAVNEGTCITKPVVLGDVGGFENFCSKPINALEG